MTDLEIVRAIAAQWVSEKRTAWDALEAICKQLGIRVPESNASSVSAPTLERNGYTLTTIDGRPCILNPEGVTIKSQRPPVSSRRPSVSFRGGLSRHIARFPRRAP